MGGRDRRIAVLGAGLSGTCVALELAEAGCRVDLYERSGQALSGASYSNEGKLHLGLVYAKDASGRTAATMVEGAARFRALLGRWIEDQVFEEARSTPFVYAVPRDSMMDVPAIRAHFGRVAALVAERGVAVHGRGEDAPLWREMSRSELAETFDPSRVRAAFRTVEHAYDPRLVCHGLRRALASAGRIEFRPCTRVVGVEPAPRGGWRVRYQAEGAPGDASYDDVVNACWEQRCAIDATAGFPAPKSLAHRYKLGLHCHDPAVVAAMPTVTFMLGSYGDTVAFGGRAYASWYPAGLLRQEFALAPGPGDVRPDDSARRRIIEESLAGLALLMPGAARALGPRAAWELVGGWISAWGDSGIEHRGSELHQRHDIGVHTHGNYHSIDTGKFTTAPWFAAEACARILGRKAA